MKFTQKLTQGTLVKRYKRFLADVELMDGMVITAHTNNSGSMKSCIKEGAVVMLSYNNDPKRKTKYTWEMILINGGWVGLNTTVPNQLVSDAIKNGEIELLRNAQNVKREVCFLDSRFDVYCELDGVKCFVEVKNVTLKVENRAEFPDAVSVRGAKHLETLIAAKKMGIHAVMFYVIQRSDVDSFAPAYEIDLSYCKKLKEACSSGVQIIAYVANVSPQEICLSHEIPVFI